MTKIKMEKLETRKTKTTKKKTIITQDVKTESVSVKEAVRNLGINKQYLKTKNVFRMTLRLPKVAVNGDKSVCIVWRF